MAKIIALIMDGASDRIGKRVTPLQLARKPNIDSLARNGVTGIMDVIAPGIRPGSDTAHLALLGYEPFEVYAGRGAFEAAGAGIELKGSDVAFRCNFATVDDNFRVIDRRAGRIKETYELGKALNNLKIDDVRIIFKPTVEHRGVLVLRGKGLSHNITDVDPYKENARTQWSKPVSGSNAEKRTASILNKFVKQSYKILKNCETNLIRASKGMLPANIILPRGAGASPKLVDFSKRYSLSAACIAGVALVKGVCKLAGFDLIDVEGATGGINTDVKGKLDAGVKALDSYDFVLINIKAPDIYSHDGNYEGKLKIIEKIDRACRVLTQLDCIKIITCDHSTPVSVKDHSSDAVPFAIAGENVPVDDVKKFDELSCAKGAIHRIRGNALINIALDFAGKAKKFGT
jgi:2,3-bisphosphoglycerate-independent phosphoglycerate mutase